MQTKDLQKLINDSTAILTEAASPKGTKFNASDVIHSEEVKFFKSCGALLLSKLKGKTLLDDKESFVVASIEVKFYNGYDTDPRYEVDLKDTSGKIRQWSDESDYIIVDAKK